MVLHRRSFAPMLITATSASTARLAAASCAGTEVPPICWGPRTPSVTVAPVHARFTTFQSLTFASVIANANELRSQASSASVASSSDGPPMPAAVESPITMASTCGCDGPGAAATGGASSRPTSSLRLPTSRRMPGAVNAVSRTADRFTASTNNTPPIEDRAVLRPPYLRHPAIAPRSRMAPNATNPASHAK